MRIKFPAVSVGVFCVAITVVAVGGRPAWAAAEYQGLLVDVDTTWCGMVHGGYYPVNVSLRSAVDAPLDIVLELETRTGSGGTKRITRQLTLDPGERVRTTLPIPAHTSLYGSKTLQVVVNKRRPKELRLHVPTWRIDWNPDRNVSVLVLSERGVDTKELEKARPSKNPVTIIDPYQLPTSWLPYTAVDLLLADAQTVEKLTPAHRQRLMQWVATGGLLLVYNADQTDRNRLAELLLGPPPWLPGTTLELNDWPYYFGLVKLARGTVFPGTAGGWNTLLKTDLTLWARKLRLDETSGRRRYYRSSPFGPMRAVRPPSRNSVFRDIPGLEEVPVTGFVWLITLFAIVVGPVNYLILKWKRVLHWIVFTSPTIALVTIMILVGFSFYSEGFGIRGIVHSLTLLDQRQHRAVSWSTHSIYAGLPPRGGLRFAADTAVLFPQSAQIDSTTLDWSQDQHLASGWARARTITNYATARSAVARQRLQVEQTADDRVTITNGLGTHLEELFVRWGAQYGAAKNLEPGEEREVELENVDLLARQGRLDLPSLPLVRRAYQHWYAPYSYVAVCRDSPFVENGHDAVNETDSQHTILGLLEKP